MLLIDQIRDDMFKASKEGRDFESEILKIAIASVKNEEFNKGKELIDSEVEEILRKEVKKVKDSIEQYKEMGRDDLVEAESKQLEVLEKYLPELMPEEEIRKVVEEKISQLGASSMRDMGKVMGVVMGELKGKADGGDVRKIVQELLS